MKRFPIMAMKAGDEVTVIGEWVRVTGTVLWWDNYEGFRVAVKLENGAEEVYEASGPRACQFWH